jgi:hypothetical protein
MTYFPGQYTSQNVPKSTENSGDINLFNSGDAKTPT